MSLRFAAMLATLWAICAIAVPAVAMAETVTVGSPLTASFTSLTMCEQLCTMANTKLGESGAQVASPTAGTIVRWRLIGAVGTFRLRLLRPDGAGGYTAVATSAPQTPTGTGVEVFAASIPVQAGDLLGIDNGTTGDEIGIAIAGVPGSQFLQFRPQPAEGADTSGGTVIPPEFDEEVGFNADVEATPALTPPTLPIQAPAPAPRTCKVPNLSGLKLKAAKKKLRAADCKLGTVTKRKGATVSGGRVVRQSPKAKRSLAGGSVVKLTLGAA